MPRFKPKTDVLRSLFARSGNQCAFPGCNHPIFNSNNQLIVQVCHIEAAEKGGERFNPNSNDEYRRSYENLLILCYPHHIETNDVEEYPVERLKEMKNKHEQMFEKSDFKINEAELFKLSHEMEKYWDDIERRNKIDHIYLDSDLAMDVNGKSNFFEIMLSAYDAVAGIQHLLESLQASDEKLQQDFDDFVLRKGISKEIFNDIPYYENPFKDRNFGTHNLDKPNWLQRLRIDLTHIEIKYFEEYLKTNSNDLVAKAKFEKAKEIFKEFARTAMHVD